MSTSVATTQQVRHVCLGGGIVLAGTVAALLSFALGLDVARWDYPVIAIGSTVLTAVAAAVIVLRVMTTNGLRDAASRPRRHGGPLGDIGLRETENGQRRLASFRRRGRPPGSR